jgi:GTP-binding protein Era
MAGLGPDGINAPRWNDFIQSYVTTEEGLELIEEISPGTDFPSLTESDQRLLATEITREQLYQQLHEELPYDSAVRPEKYEVRPDGSIEIHQQIVVARETQRAIVLGKGGARIKAIGAAARAELSEVLGVPVHLYLHVKQLENWAEDKEIFEEMGLDWVR